MLDEEGVLRPRRDVVVSCIPCADKRPASKRSFWTESNLDETCLESLTDNIWRWMSADSLEKHKITPMMRRRVTRVKPHATKHSLLDTLTLFRRGLGLLFVVDADDECRGGVMGARCSSGEASGGSSLQPHSRRRNSRFAIATTLWSATIVFRSLIEALGLDGGKNIA